MTDDTLEAAPEAVEEIVQTEVSETEAPEAAESTEGEPAEVAAEDQAEGKQPGAEAEDKEKLTRNQRRREAKERAEREYRESEAARIDAEQKLAQHQEAAQSLPKPKLEDYADYEEFQAANSAYYSVQALDSREAQRLQAEAEAQFQRTQSAKQRQQEQDAQNWADQAAEAKARYPDFDQVAMRDDVPISNEMARQIVQSDVAADLAYHIGKNPDVGAAMSQMDPIGVARALGRLEAQLSAPKPKTVSTAPDPITPVRGKSSVSKDPGDMSPDEYRAWIDSGGKF